MCGGTGSAGVLRPGVVMAADGSAPNPDQVTAVVDRVSLVRIDEVGQLS